MGNAVSPVPDRPAEPGRYAGVQIASHERRSSAALDGFTRPGEQKGMVKSRCGIGAVATNNHGRRRNGADSLGPYRVLIYSPDSFGLGHLQRCKTIVDALVEQHRKLHVLMLSGSPIIGRFSFQARVDHGHLPRGRRPRPGSGLGRGVGERFWENSEGNLRGNHTPGRGAHVRAR